MTYATYEFYTDEYRGSVIPSQIAFDPILFGAARLLDNFTQGRIVEVDKSVSFAACAMADLLYTDQQNSGKDIASEKVGTWSISYVNNNKSLKSKCFDAAAMYLGDTGLLYQGVRG